MLEQFTNPGFFAAGSALVSAPIVIHLINRMRFRRLRWAAMEFLLKAQKRNRRRLIIEQLLLLALRCLLVMLAALLVLRFVGFSLAGYAGEDSLHLVILDDTLSMNDRIKEGNLEISAFKVAKEEGVFNNIFQKVSQSTTNERLAIIPLSELLKNPDFEPVIYQKLGEQKTKEEVRKALDDMKPTKLHVDLALGLERASAIIEQHPEKRPVVHIVSDFRVQDWSGEQGEKTKKVLERLAKQKVTLRLVDAAHPLRLEDQGGVPMSNENVAIVDFRANSRLVGNKMPVTFTATVANNSPNDKRVDVKIYRYVNTKNADTGLDEIRVDEQLELTFIPAMPFVVPANGVATAQFKYTPEVELKEGINFHSEKFAVHFDMVEGDGVAGDNIRFASVQVRNKIPILIIDSDGQSGDNTLYVETALRSISDSYDIYYGDKVANNIDPTEVLKSANLMNYAAIYLLNVEKLTQPGKDKLDDTKLKNLENYVKEGGSVAFFLGPKVSGKYYTEQLYRKGKGIFPAPIADNPTYNPEVDPKNANVPGKNFLFGSQMLLRDDKYALQDIPIFGGMITKDFQKESLKFLSVVKHFSVIRDQWEQEKGQVFELAALPNKKAVFEAGLDATVSSILEKLNNLLKDNEEYNKLYRKLIQEYDLKIRNIFGSGQSIPAYQLGLMLEEMLTDAANTSTEKNAPKLTEFWAKPDPKVGELRKEIKDVTERAIFGDPFVVTRQFGKGRVVAVMSTAGTEWNDWGYGLAKDLWPLFQKYSLNYMFDQTAESSLLVGAPYAIDVKVQKYKDQAKQLKLIRDFYEARVNQQVKLRKAIVPGTLSQGVQSFSFKDNYDDGFYLSQIFSDDEKIKTPLESWEHVFNVDTKTESKLARISQEEIKSNVLFQNYSGVKIHGYNFIDPVLINKKTDLSESPWFYLFFLLILVCEQALAVHLSFHLRGSENQVPAQAATSQLKAA